MRSRWRTFSKFQPTISPAIINTSPRRLVFEERLPMGFKPRSLSKSLMYNKQVCWIFRISQIHNFITNKCDNGQRANQTIRQHWRTAGVVPPHCSAKYIISNTVGVLKIDESFQMVQICNIRSVCANVKLSGILFDLAPPSGGLLVFFIRLFLSTSTGPITALSYARRHMCSCNDVTVESHVDATNCKQNLE